jgi:transposase, IS5 family
MRRLSKGRPALPPIDDEHAREVRAIDEILDSEPELLELVMWDLLQGADPENGRPGMSAEQVLRAAIAQKLLGCGFRRLRFHLADSRTYQGFCRFAPREKIPKKSALAANIRRLRPETLEQIHRGVVRNARKRGIEKARKVRVDCTVTQTNIHEPTDSSLLWDGVRSIYRLLEVARLELGLEVRDRSRSAKNTAFAISSAKTEQERKGLYEKLLGITHKALCAARRACRQLDALAGEDPEEGLDAEMLSVELGCFIEMTQKVVLQTKRRVFEGRQVPASQKIVSLFEPHTNIITKKNRETLFGHKLCLTTGRSSIILDLVVLRGNPADSTLAQQMVERQKEIFGKLPRQVSFDGAFASGLNLRRIQAMGVKDVAFAKKRGLQVQEMTSSKRVYQALRRFRAGVEGCISYVKRCFGLRRCLWRGLEAFCSYAWCSVITANLLIMAHHELARA